MYTDFEDNAYESASEAVLFCEEHLRGTKQNNAAIYLEGLSPVVDQATATAAHYRLLHARKIVRDSVAICIVQQAINAVARALNTPVLLATG